jgi:PAS domain S-box-containing protein
MSAPLDRFAAVVESSDDTIVTTTPDGTITSWNRAATQLFGYNPAEAIGRPITILFPRERLGEEAELRPRIARGERVDHFETQRVRKDGTKVDVSTALSPVKDQYGQIVEICTIARDITARKDLEAEAREQTALFQVMADSAPVMIWAAGPDTLCTFFNKPWLQFTGRTLEKEFGNGWAEGVHPDDLSRCLDVYLSAFKGRRPFRMEYRLRRADGQYRWVLDTGVPRHAARGEFAGYIGSAVDITDMKAAADTLAAEIQTTRAFFESAAEGILVVDQAGRIVRATARGEAMFGYAPAELLGQPIERLLPERFRAAHHGHRAHYFDAPRPRSMGLGRDLLGQRKDGGEFPVEISLTSIQTPDGLLAMALVTDISGQRGLERAARQQEKLAALATLSAGIAHELNNPIGIISTRIELMLDEVESQPLPAAVVDDLHVLYRNIQRITRIATGLLSFARQSPEESGPVHVNTVIEETLLLVGRQLGKDGVQVSVTLDQTVGPMVPSGFQTR